MVFLTTQDTIHPFFLLLNFIDTMLIAQYLSLLYFFVTLLESRCAIWFNPLLVMLYITIYLQYEKSNWLFHFYYHNDDHFLVSLCGDMRIQKIHSLVSKVIERMFFCLDHQVYLLLIFRVNYISQFEVDIFVYLEKLIACCFYEMLLNFLFIFDKNQHFGKILFIIQPYQHIALFY